MPKLTEHQGATTVKGLIVGDAGSGKTSGLESLAKAGYKLRIWDFDNLLGSLFQRLKRSSPQALDNVMFQTFTDEFKGDPNPMMMNGKQWLVKSPVDGVPKAYPNALQQLDHWKVAGEDLGKPKEWDTSHVVVIDTLTTMSSAAFRYAFAMNPMGDPRNNYGNAQNLITNMLDNLCSKNFRPHVLVMGHITYETNHLGMTKGFPRSVGQALNDQIAAKFNLVLQVETAGSTKIVRSNSTGVIDLKNPVNFKVQDPLPLETGYAEVFKAITT